jgi:hypothetical protein
VERTYTREEKSLVLFFETCLVDGMGRVASAHMNAEDLQIAENLAKEGLIEFGRLNFKTVSKFHKPRPSFSRQYTHWVRFTDKAWQLTHQWRRERSEQVFSKYAKELDKERVVRRKTDG